MNKILLVALAFVSALGFTSCSTEEDDIFSQSAAERLNSVKSTYTSRLMASPYGWAMQMYPTYKNSTPQGRGYLLMLGFSKDNSVSVSGILNKAYVADTSLWEIISDDGPVLTFNSHNDVLHYFSDPSDLIETPDDDESGKGMEGDYEFIITDAPDDGSYMMLKGKKRGTYNLLTPLSEKTDFQEYLTDVKNFTENIFPSNYPTYSSIVVGDSVYRMSEAQAGLPKVYTEGQDSVITRKFRPFLITKRPDGYYLRFRDAFVLPNGSKAQDFKYIAENDQFESVENKAYLIKAAEPLDFFVRISNGALWNFQRSNASSTSFSDIYAQLTKDFRARKLTLSGFSLQADTLGGLAVRVNYVNSRNVKSSMIYKYSYTLGDNNTMKITYIAPQDEKSGNAIIAQIPTLKSLLDLFSQEYALSADNTRFNLKTIKLTATANKENWFVLAM